LAGSGLNTNGKTIRIAALAGAACAGANGLEGRRATIAVDGGAAATVDYQRQVARIGTEVYLKGAYSRCRILIMHQETVHILAQAGLVHNHPGTGERGRGGVDRPYVYCPGASASGVGGVAALAAVGDRSVQIPPAALAAGHLADARVADGAGMGVTTAIAAAGTVLHRTELGFAAIRPGAITISPAALTTAGARVANAVLAAAIAARAAVDWIRSQLRLAAVRPKAIAVGIPALANTASRRTGGILPAGVSATTAVTGAGV